MGRVFALSDLHGQWGLWQQIKQFLNQDDKLYFLGDAIDRGPRGYDIMKELLCDNRVIYIMGNHEYMMMNALREMHRNEDIFSGEECQLWAWNGCYPTLEAWQNDGMMYDWIHVINEMPTEITYINTEEREICLCHAGFTPGLKPRQREDMVWDRQHIIDKITEEWADGGFVVVHGHTPTPHLMTKLDEANRVAAWANRDRKWEYQEKNGIVVYADGVKVDIDCGCFATGHTVLLDLDSWKTYSFNADIEE